MDPEGNDYLILVDAAHPLSKDYVPKDLTVCANYRRDGRDPQTMRLFAAKAMDALFLEAEADGMLYKNKVEGHESQVLSLTTAYRSYSYQEYLFNSYVKRDQEEHPDWTHEQVVKEVSTYSCPPGTSEHQSGLCTDMHNWPTAGRYMAKDFAASPAGKWLQENCYKFGFILRFPEDKTEITGITYESWHFRYVGRFHATRMHELNMCLEEYLDYLSGYGYVINGDL